MARPTGAWPTSSRRTAPPKPGARVPPDHLGAFAVTAGLGLKEIVEGFKARHDDYNAILAEALADRLAEAFAEYVHQRVRDEWGFGRTSTSPAKT